MFAYCGNNPVSRADDGGEFWHIIAGAVVGAAVSFASSILGDIIAGKEVDLIGAGISAAFGAVGGALAATGFGAVVQIVGGAALAGAENIVEQGREDGFNNIDYGEVAINAVIGGISSRNNGVSKATAGHLFKQDDALTKRILNSIKHDSHEEIGPTIKASLKYYYSQTKTLFYEPLISNAQDDFGSSIKGSLVELFAMTVY